ncbi:MAG: hypothetical protein ACRD38_11140 [Nitrososphaerales archaeon]
MGNSAAAPVIAGLAVGIAFVVGFSWAVSLNMLLPRSSTQEDDASKSAVEITRNLDEVKEFLSNYPAANTTVYFITRCADESCSSLSRIPSIVEYWYRGGDGGKYTDLRITVNFEERKVLLFQLRCLTEGSENNGIEVHGSSLRGITEFLQDSRCPK